MAILRRFRAGACAALAFSLAAVAPAAADTILYNDFAALGGLQLNGSTRSIHGCAPSGDGATCAAVAGNVLRLTDNLSQGGSTFSTNLISLDQNASFSTAFQFRISDPQGSSDSDGQGADGLVFVVQTVANTAGGIGGGIGYQGLNPSLGVEFDTWNNGGIDGGNGNHVGVNINGSTLSNPRVNIDTTNPGRMNNGSVWYAWVDYDGASNTLEVRLNTSNARPGAALISTSIDLVNILGTTDAYVGFTSGTGSAGGDHDILAWQFQSSFDPIEVVGDVPEPAPLAAIAAALIGAALWRRYRRRKG